MKASVVWLLYALCVTAVVAAHSADVRDTEAQGGVHLRALAEQGTLQNEGNGKPNGQAANEEGAAKRALHRVYDPVTGLYCERIGDCHTCPASEKDEVYCRDTGHRQELSCPKPSQDGEPMDAENGPKVIRFAACTPIEKAQPAVTVVKFEVVMAFLLAGAFALLKKERRKHMSSFDMRKDEKKQRGALLGDKNHD